MMKFSDVILASASPRREELLKLIFEDFKICPSGVEEVLPDDISADKSPEYLAVLKARDIASCFPNSLVIGADTSVIIGDRILGKPKNREEAYEMLTLLSGNTHKVITGCALINENICHSFSVTTLVKFYKLSAKEIEAYISTTEPYDKAGGYGIQSKGALFVEEIRGDYFNVVGLPIARLKNEIGKILPEN